MLLLAKLLAAWQIALCFKDLLFSRRNWSSKHPHRQGRPLRRQLHSSVRAQANRKRSVFLFQMAHPIDGNKFAVGQHCLNRGRLNDGQKAFKDLNVTFGSGFPSAWQHFPSNREADTFVSDPLELTRFSGQCAAFTPRQVNEVPQNENGLVNGTPLRSDSATGTRSRNAGARDCTSPQ